MAYYYISYRKPALLTLMLLVLLKKEHVRAARSLSAHENERPPLHIKLDLTRLDIPHAGNFTYAHMQQAFQRSSLRLARFHDMLQLHGAGAGGAAASLSSSSTYQTPVFADGGGFLTTLSIGTPPVSFNAVVDTGSHVVWLQCKPCSPCYTNHGPNTIFDPSLSSTYSLLPCSNALCNYLPTASHSCSGTGTTATCSYKFDYGDRSHSSHSIGDLSLDALTLPDPSGTAQRITSFAFGCGHDNQGTSFNAGVADGIVGLGLGPLSLPSQLGSSHLSYCLQSITEPPSKTSPLYLGEALEVPPGLTLTTQFFTNPKVPINNAPYYYVNLNGISVGGKLVTASSNGAFDIQSDGSGGIIFDSGTTITYLQSDIYNSIVDAFTSAIALPLAPIDGLCYELSSASNIQLPSLTFHFEGADLELPRANSFISLEEDNLICLALGPSMLPNSIFGNIQQQNFFITYDLQAHTISLTSTTCDSL